MGDLKINSDKIALFTDLHLGVHQNSGTWHGIATNWAKWFIDQLKSNDIDTVFFTGDFFHSRSEISVNTIQAASDLLKQFNNDFRIIMIPGNHDCYYKDKSDVNSLSILDGYKNITVLDKVTTVEVGKDKKRFVFCPWGYSSEEIECADVILGHFEIESFKMNAHKLCEHGFKPKDLLNKAPLIFSGHFHLNEEREYDEGKIIYVGSPFQLDFGERDTRKGFYIINVPDLTFNFVENNITPVHKKFLASEFDKVDLQQAVQGNFIKLVLDINLDQDRLDNIVRKINECSPISLTIDPLINYTINYNGDSDQDLSGIDISKAIIEFVNLLDIADKEGVVKKTIDLYNQTK